ncbi:unnamed protein product [Clonostachys rosea f. rosea IK726]|uniref:Glutathione S-transferase n=2 Tax=Bionectria ochroleuca TaxID=29856 RepID=A0A0B7JVM8_BIOOC|nr:unnamed protein product [Clonostachys rosea f. rosea IK726]
MAEPDSKRLKTEDAPYELVYWHGLPGRGEFIRLLFVEAGVPWKDTSDKGMEASTGQVLELISPDSGPSVQGKNPPVCAVPALRHGDVLLSQTPNILQYLAPRLGLAPKEGVAVYHLNQIVLTLIDGFVTELHDTHHPISVAAYYEDQKPEAKKRSKFFIEERIPKFLGYAQRVLEAETSGEGPWLYGDSLTYADLVLFQSIDGTQFAFPKTFQKLKESGKYDGVFKLYDTIKERPAIKEYLASDRRQKYGDGIWRHYPELEEEDEKKE